MSCLWSKSNGCHKTTVQVCVLSVLPLRRPRSGADKMLQHISMNAKLSGQAWPDVGDKEDKMCINLRWKPAFNIDIASTLIVIAPRRDSRASDGRFNKRCARSYIGVMRSSDSESFDVFFFFAKRWVSISAYQSNASAVFNISLHNHIASYLQMYILGCINWSTTVNNISLSFALPASVE